MSKYKIWDFFSFASSSRASLVVTILSHHISLNYTQHPKKSWEASYFLSGVVWRSCKTFCHSFIRFHYTARFLDMARSDAARISKVKLFLCSHGDFNWRLKRWCVRVDHKLNCDYIYCLNNWQERERICQFCRRRGDHRSARMGAAIGNLLFRLLLLQLIEWGV